MLRVDSGRVPFNALCLGAFNKIRHFAANVLCGAIFAWINQQLQFLQSQLF